MVPDPLAAWDPLVTDPFVSPGAGRPCTAGPGAGGAGAPYACAESAWAAGPGAEWLAAGGICGEGPCAERPCPLGPGVPGPGATGPGAEWPGVGAPCVDGPGAEGSACLRCEPVLGPGAFPCLDRRSMTRVPPVPSSPRARRLRPLAVAVLSSGRTCCCWSRGESWCPYWPVRGSCGTRTPSQLRGLSCTRRHGRSLGDPAVTPTPRSCIAHRRRDTTADRPN